MIAEARQGTRVTLTPSETVYFHPEAFARRKAVMDALGLVHTDQKYDASELATSIVATAILAAERAGAVALETGKSSRLFGLRKVDALHVRAAGPSPHPPGSLEAAVARAVQAKPQDVERVVIDILREDAPDPHAWAVALVAKGLAERQLLAVEETKRLKVFRVQSYSLPPATAELAKATPPTDARALLDEAKARGDTWKLLTEGMARGFTARTERGDSGPD